MDTIVSPAPTAPANTPIPQIVDALRQVAALHGLADREYEWLATRCEEVCYPAGAALFREGDPATKMSIILRGEIHVRRQQSGVSLFLGRSGQITGVLPFSRMKTHGGEGFAATDVWGLQLDREQFPEMLAAIPSMGQRCVSVLLDRVREMTRLEQQTEKLNALGKLAGNLAHELNNPASAAQRAASGLIEELRIYGQQKFLLGSLCLDEKHLENVRAWSRRIAEQARTQPANTVTQVEREDRPAALAARARCRAGSADRAGPGRAGHDDPAARRARGTARRPAPRNRPRAVRLLRAHRAHGAGHGRFHRAHLRAHRRR